MGSAKRKEAPAEPRSFDAYEVVEVHRSELKDAPYNPRVLSDKARRKLRAGVEKLGLLAPVTWNETSGNLVGGHQRMKVLDALHGTSDYRLKVARVRLDDVKEREANVLLNNAEAQGDWDIAKLEQILHDTPTIDLEATGFDMSDVYRMFGGSPFENRTDDALSKVAETVREAAERFEAIRQNNAARDADNFFLCFVFRDAATLGAFLDGAGLDDNRYQSGEELAAKLGIRLDPAEPED